MMNKRFGTLFDSPLFKESAENDDEFDASEVAGEDLSYLDDIDEDEDEEESEGEGDDTEEDDFEDEEYDDSEEDEDFDGEEGYDEFSEDEEFGDEDFGGEAPQLTSNTYESGKAEEEPKMFYPSEEEVTLEVIEETGNGAVGDEPALAAMEMETPEADSVEVGESQTELPEVPEEYDFEGVYNSEIEDFDNGFGANLETSTESDEGMESDFDVEEEGDDFGTDEDEEFESEDDEDFDADEDFDGEEEFEDEESDDVEAEGVDFDDDFDSEEDDEDFDIDTDEDDFEEEEDEE